MNHLIPTTAVYENGVLRLNRPIPDLADGDRVEVVVVRVVPVDRNHPAEVARRERIDREARERLAALPPDPDDGSDILEVLDAARRRIGARPLLPDPPEVRG